MFVDQIAALFQDFADEDDGTFLDAARKARYLQSGYDAFYRLAMQYAPQQLMTNIVITVTGDFYDLGGTVNPVRILGNSLLPLGTKRMRVLREVYRGTIIADGDAFSREQRLEGVPDLRVLDDTEYGRQSPRYSLRGSVLVFDQRYSAQTFLLGYIPAPTVDWAKQTSGQNEFVDDFDDFHDLVALLSYAYYAIRDGRDNPMLSALAQERRQEFVDYLTTGRNPEAHERVW